MWNLYKLDYCYNNDTTQYFVLVPVPEFSPDMHTLYIFLPILNVSITLLYGIKTIYLYIKDDYNKVMTDREFIYVRSKNGITIPDEFVKDFKDIIRDEGLDCLEVHCMLEANIVKADENDDRSFISLWYEDENGVEDELLVFGWKEC